MININWSIHFIFGLGFYSSVVHSSAIQSPRVTNWGHWGHWDDCPPETFIHGMRLKVEKMQEGGIDDTALNGVQFFCSRQWSTNIVKNVTSLTGLWGDWQEPVTCNGTNKAIGFQLRSEGSQDWNDDTAANDLRLICQGGQILEGGGLDWGNWTRPMICPSYKFLCGVRTQIEPELGSGDDTAMNNLDMDCCSVYRP